MNQGDSWTIMGTQAATYEEIDRRIVDLARSRWEAESVVLPSSIALDDLGELGYMDRFAGHLTVAHAFADAQVANGLVPAACLSLYSELRNLHVIEDRAFTSRVKVFRYELGSRRPGRLWEFNVRELVFVGTPEYVKATLADVRSVGSDLLLGLGIPTTVAVAADYFTPADRRTDLLKQLQRDAATKYEWCFEGKVGSMAVGSLNYHGYHFSKVFDWPNWENVVSGCVGFGLERCLIARTETSEGENHDEY